MYNFNSKMNGMAIVATVMQNIIKNNLFLLNAIIELTGTLFLFISISSLRRECVNIFSMSKKCKFEVSIFFLRAVQKKDTLGWAKDIVRWVCVFYLQIMVKNEELKTFQREVSVIYSFYYFWLKLYCKCLR